MRAHVFQHVPFEDLGSIRPWLDERGADISYTRFFANDPIPPLADLDALIVLGGPMSVNDEHDLPWLRAEKQAVRDALVHDVPLLGICLGAQLLANALGARVYPNAMKEIGWFPVRGVTNANDGASVFHFPAESTVFHWHGETFDLPANATNLASSVACEHQAFQLTRRAIGLQFHLETTAEAARAMVEHGQHELVPGPYIQTAQQLLEAPAACYQGANHLMREVLTWLFEA
jgi:GMP synthase-like glutamine amidotransferase